MHRAQASDDVFRAIARPHARARISIACAPDRPMPVRSPPTFRQSRPAISKHLRVLRQARLVTDTRIGASAYMHSTRCRCSVAGWLEGYRAFWQTSLAG
jgi:DNA-binding transcriptional ArsR family regulator